MNIYAIEQSKNQKIVYLYIDHWYKIIFDKPVKVFLDNDNLIINNEVHTINIDKLIKVSNYEVRLNCCEYKEFIVWIEFLNKYQLIAHLNNGKKKFVDLQPLIAFDDYYKFIETYFYRLLPMAFEYQLEVPGVEIDGDNLIIYNNYIKDLPYMEE